MQGSLVARLSTPNWIDELAWVILGIRTAHKEYLRISGAEIVHGDTLTVHGDTLTVPGDFVSSDTKSHRNYNRFLLHIMELGKQRLYPLIYSNQHICLLKILLL